ncbi:MAG: ABC transporter permease [Nitrososphaerales archaeon]
MRLDYVVKRFANLLLVVFLAITLNFILPRLTPGDPVEQKLNQLVATSGGQVGDVSAMIASYRAKFGLDQPVWKQYLNYWSDLLHLDLGYSLDRYPERVSATIKSALPWTIGLVGVSTLIAFVIGTFLGALLGWPRVPRLLKGLIPTFMVVSAIPYFLLGILLLFVFAIVLKVLPAGGGYPFGMIPRLDWATATTILRHATLPGASIILAGIGAWALTMRGMMIGTLGEDYITLAEAKGLKQRRIFAWYAMRNGLLPQITVLALTLSHVVAGTILVEVMFAYPGIGFKLFQAVGAKDYFVIQGIVLMIVLSIAVVLFILDLIYPLIDPRIVYERR